MPSSANRIIFAKRILGLAAIALVTIVENRRLVVADPRHQSAHEAALLLEPHQVVHHTSRHQTKITGINRDLDRRHAANEPVEHFRGDFLEPGFAFARAALRIDDVEPFQVLGVERRNELRWILKVGIHHHHRSAAAQLDTGGDRDLVAEISAQVDAAHTPVSCAHFHDSAPRTIAAAVVDHDDLVRKAGRRQHLGQPLVQLADALLFVVDGKDDAEIDRGGVSGHRRWRVHIVDT